MEIRAEIKQVFDGTKPTKAIADVIIDNSVVIHGVRLIEKDDGRFISMPYDKWTDKNGEEKRRDIAHPISSTARRQIQDAVSAAFDQHAEERAEEYLREEVIENV